MLRLYTYFRSSAAFRTRIALNLKGLAYESVPVHLARNDQHSASFAERNPAHLIPVLEDEGLRLTQSMAIMEYLEERYPKPPLLPSVTAVRAEVRSLSLSIACDIHPLNNLRVLRYLKSPLGVDEATRNEWARHWIALGFTALEQRLSQGGYSGRCCYGDSPGMADCCLIPQTVNALRVQCPLDPFPTIRRIYEHCMGLEAFQRAAPAAQSDAEP
jgi:maleylacetoacetate isomerase